MAAEVVAMAKNAEPAKAASAAIKCLQNAFIRIPVVEPSSFRLGCLPLFYRGSRRFEQPALFVALRVKLLQRCKTAADRRKGNHLSGIGDCLGHDAPGAVSELVETPQLFRATGEGRNDD